MKERNTIVDTWFDSMSRDFKASSDMLGKPVIELWNRTAETRERARGEVYKMLRLRVAKIQPIPRRVRWA